MTRRAPGFFTSCALMVVGLAVGGAAQACLGTFSGDARLLPANKGDDTALGSAVAAAEAAHRSSPALETTNDLAVAWILAGRVADAIPLLRELDETRPGSALVAANLGMALELSGDYEEALVWVREGIRRDPTEHQGSEWAHLKILEARLALARNPGWLRRSPVIGWREGQRLPPDERSQPRTHRDLVEAIRYQLDMRTPFIAPPDPVLGDLFQTLGDIAHTAPAAFGGTWERDRVEARSYEAALRYGTVFEAKARERKAAADERVRAATEALAAKAKRDQETRAREEATSRAADERRRKIESEQRRRRLMPLIAFGVLAVVVAVALFWPRKRAS